MTKYFLGADAGGTKTHVLIADETGQVTGFGESGPGGTDGVGFSGLGRSLQAASNEAFKIAGIGPVEIAGAGFGVSGYDWPWQREPTLSAIQTLGMSCPVELVNDSILGILAGSEEGWGVAVVSGTGCNCYGWDRDRRQIGHLTGGGGLMGEGAGATELVDRAIQLVAHHWSKRGPATELTSLFIKFAGATSHADLLEGLMSGRYRISTSAAPLIFQVATQGDIVAKEAIRWAGCELGEMAKAVIRQLGFESLHFDVVLVGSLYNGGELLIQPMRETIHQLAPGANLIRLNTPPVTGAVMLGMEQAHLRPDKEVRERINLSINCLRQPANLIKRVI